MMDVDERVEAQRATLARAKAERKNAAARAKYRARVTESGEPEPVAATTWWQRQVPVWEQAYRVKVALDAAVAAIAGAVAATAAVAAAPLASRIACNGASSAAAAPLAPRTSVSGAAVAPRRHCAPVTCAPTCVVDAADDDTIAVIMSQSREVLARLAVCCRRLHTLATMHPVLWKLGTLYRHQSAWRRRQQAASVWRLAHPSPPYHAERASIVKQLLGVQHPRADFSLLVDEGKDRERRVIYTLHGYDAIRRELLSLLWECHDSHGCARRAHAVGFFHNGPSSVIRDRRVCVPVEGLMCVACAAGCDDKCGLLCHCGATPPPTLTRPRARSGRGH